MESKEQQLQAAEISSRIEQIRLLTESEANWELPMWKERATSLRDLSIPELDSLIMAIQNRQSGKQFSSIIVDAIRHSKEARRTADDARLESVGPAKMSM